MAIRRGGAVSTIKTCVTCNHYVFLLGAERCSKAVTQDVDPVSGHQVIKVGISNWCSEQRRPGIGALFGWRCGSWNPGGEFGCYIGRAQAREP